MRVSVIMPAYNAERYLAEAINSVLAQTHADFEIIIIDDGSTDSTPIMLKRFAEQDSRIKVLRKKNQGIAYALNAAIDLAANDWLVRMDADDVMLPDRIERQVRFITKHPNLAVASGFVHYIDETGRIIGKGTSDLTSWKAIEETVAKNELVGFHHPAVIMKKAIIQEVGGYRPETVPAEDLELWNRVIQQGHKVLVQPEYLLKYRIHGQSTSVRRAREARLKLQWVKACVLSRNLGQAELSWEKFLEDRSRQPVLKRLNQERKDLAKVLYKAAVFQYARRSYPSFLSYIIGATALQPSYVYSQVRAKYLMPSNNAQKYD